VSLEPDNWRHHFRRAFVSWGEERLRAAHKTTALLPGFPLAHWLAATVHVARQVLPEAVRELEAGIASQTSVASGSRFSSVALHWMLGLTHLAQGDHSHASEHFERELAREGEGHLYARECAANTWYAIGALRLREGRGAEARTAFEHAIARVTRHPLARVGLAASDRSRSPRTEPDLAAKSRDLSSFDASICDAAGLAVAGNHVEAATLVSDALAAAPPGSAGWILPIEPLLHVAARPDAWSRTLARLRSRAV
jgi:tetratricopeptide (TPR) repeat protein